MAEAIIYLGPIITAFIVLALVFIALKLGKSIIWLLINSAIGIIILLIINFFPFINITINIWSVLIAVFGGIPGIILLIVLDLLKIAF
ncbi:MAG TPA: sigmaK-factor processing regulatory BofA [Candidatus Diapherotrites archaeon]|uniref:SigmaK-factor processing regulatory BofA n=1 Tax=Candidatus Iainarchaeum sp. TaxID=3101447 RepID=A0A7J4IUX9_9ARCH|nr:sigmaK-factor processing regulatory BofA [Candidatus Diapherotrites archaeon]